MLVEESRVCSGMAAVLRNRPNVQNFVCPRRPLALADAFRLLRAVGGGGLAMACRHFSVWELQEQLHTRRTIDREQVRSERERRDLRGFCRAP
jgi:hypothetical protein